MNAKWLPALAARRNHGAEVDRWRRATCGWLILAICICSGCEVWHDVKKTTKNEWIYKSSNHLIEKRVRSLGREYWNRYLRSHPNCEGNEHFRNGLSGRFREILSHGAKRATQVAASQISEGSICQRGRPLCHRTVVPRL